SAAYPDFARSAVTAFIWSFNPHHSWITTRPGKGPFPWGRARYPVSFAAPYTMVSVCMSGILLRYESTRGTAISSAAQAILQCLRNSDLHLHAAIFRQYLWMRRQRDTRRPTTEWRRYVHGKSSFQ